MSIPTVDPKILQDYYDYLKSEYPATYHCIGRMVSKKNETIRVQGSPQELRFVKSISRESAYNLAMAKRIFIDCIIRVGFIGCRYGLYLEVDGKNITISTHDTEAQAKEAMDAILIGNGT